MVQIKSTALFVAAVATTFITPSVFAAPTPDNVGSFAGSDLVSRQLEFELARSVPFEESDTLLSRELEEEYSREDDAEIVFARAEYDGGNVDLESRWLGVALRAGRAAIALGQNLFGSKNKKK